MKLVNTLKKYFSKTDYYLIILFGVISLVVTKIWFLGDDFIWGNDTAIPIQLDWVNRYYNIWSWEAMFRSIDVSKLTYLMPIGFILKLWSFTGIEYSASTFQKIFVFLLLYGSSLSGYFFYVSIFPKSKHLSRIFVALLYAFNYYSMLLWIPFPNIIVHYAFFPIILAFVIYCFNEKIFDIKLALIISILWSLSITPGYGTLPYVAIDWLIVFLFSLFFFIKNNLKKYQTKYIIFFSVLCVSWILINTTWILPLVGTFKTELVRHELPTANSTDLFKKNSVNLLDGFHFSGYYGLDSIYKENKLFPWFKVDKDLFNILIPYLIPILFVSALIFKKKQKIILFNALLAIGFIFFVKGPNEPLAFVNELLFSRKELALIFRSNYQRLMGYYVLFVTLLCGFTIDKLHTYKINSFFLKTLKDIIIALLIILIILFPVWPMINGNIFNGNQIVAPKRVIIPQTYYEIAKFLEEDHDNYMVMPLPFMKIGRAALEWSNEGHGYYGIYPLTLMTTKQFFIKDTYDKSGERIAELIRDHKLMEPDILSDYNIKYLIVNNDINSLYIKDHPWWVFDEVDNIKKSLLSVKKIKLVKSFGNIDLYINEGWKENIISANKTSNKQINLININSGNPEFYRDIIFHQSSKTLSEKTLKLILPKNDNSSYAGITFLNNGFETELTFYLIDDGPETDEVITKIPFNQLDSDMTLRIYYTNKQNSIVTSNLNLDSTLDIDFFNTVRGNWKFTNYQETYDEPYFVANDDASVLIKDFLSIKGIFEADFLFSENNVFHFPFLMNDSYGGWNYWVTAMNNGRFGYYDGQNYTSFPIETLYEENLWYRIKLKYDTNNQKFWVWINGDIKTPEGLPTKNSDNEFVDQIVNWRIVNSDFTVNTKVSVKNIKLYDIPEEIPFKIGYLKKVKNDSESFPINIISTTPVLYKFVIFNVTDSFFLKFMNLFNDGWKLYSSQNKKFIVNNHFELNGFLNGWYVDVDEYCKEKGLCIQNEDGSYDIEMTIEFFPQRLFYIGLLISGTTLFSCLSYLGYDFVRSRRQKRDVLQQAQDDDRLELLRDPRERVIRKHTRRVDSIRRRKNYLKPVHKK